MIARLSNGWELVKASWAVLQADKELVVFPIVSAVALAVVSIAFLAPIFAAGVLDNLLFRGGDSAGALTLLVGFAFYFVQYFIILFANSALIGAALIRLDGGDPTVADGIRIAWSHLPSILGYALIAATVGIILRALSRSRRGLGRIVGSILGVAWNLATFLVLPVLIVEDLGPVQGLKRSAQLLRSTWGEQITGNVSITGLFLIAGLALTLLILAPAVYLSANVSPLFLGLGLGVLIPSYLLIALLNSTMSGIFAAAVYRFATQGEAGTFFPPSLVERAFRPARQGA